MKNTKNIKSNTKRIIALALALVLIATLFTACGNKEKPAVSPDSSSNTSSSTTETGAVVPSIEGDEGTTESTTAADAGTATADAGDKNTGKPSSADKSESGKPATTTRPAQKPTSNKPSSADKTKPSSSDKPSAGKPASESTTKPAPKPETTTKPSTPSGNTYAYFRASTGERIKYLTYRGDLDQARCTGISESNGKITATYDIGASEEWWKCDNCGKYLCEGCQPIESDRCPKCGNTNCMTYSRDVTCYRCGKFVKAETCHPCNGGLPGYEYPYVRG